MGQGSNFLFGPFRFEEELEALWREGEPVALGNRAARALAALLAQAPDVVSKEDLMSAVWPGQVVEEGNLTVQISALRRCLGSEAQIATIARRGYRLQTAVTRVASRAQMPTGETSGLPIARSPNDRTLINAGDAPTIAVLPFENLSHNSRWSYFCDGLVEDIITDLAYHRDIRVIARQSSFKYRGQPHDVREIGLALGALYVLEGSLQTDSGRLKVTSQLIDARTGSHLWARRYTREEAGLFEIQEAIVGDVVAALTGFEGSILRAELARARRKHPANLRAYELYLLGYEQEARADRQGTLRAIELMELAVQADPQFSRAWTVLGWALGNAAEEGWVHDLASASGRQRHAIVEAAALDPRDGLALSELVGLQLKDGNFPAARQTVELALATGANHADTLALTAKYVSTFLGRPDEALSLMQRAFALNPHAPSWYALGEVYVCYYSRRFEAAIEAAPRATAGRSQTFCSVLSLAQLGRDAEMAAARSELYALDPELQIANDFATLAIAPAAKELLHEGMLKAGLLSNAVVLPL
jgi:TolB-like protein